MDRSLTTTKPVARASVPAAEGAQARRYQRSARSENTLRAYRASLARFASWCDARSLKPVPATPETVAAFLVSEADSGRSPATVALRAAAIAFAHRTADLPSPCDSPTVTETLRGIRRERAFNRHPAKRAAALTAERLATCLGTLDRATLRGKRDAALLTLGFALGARRSELVALDVRDLRDDGDGLHVNLYRSKTDQAGDGSDLYIPLANNPRLCAVLATREWLEATGLTDGALLRSVRGRFGIGDRLSDRSVDLVVRRCAKRASLDTEGRYSAHSLRAGLVTTLAERGRTEIEIMRQSRHKSSAMVRSYTRPLDAKQGCPLRGAF